MGRVLNGHLVRKGHPVEQLVDDRHREELAKVRQRPALGIIVSANYTPAVDLDHHHQ